MLLAIDVGNTNTVFALYKNETLEHVWRCVTTAGRSRDEYAAFLYPLLSASDLTWADIYSVIVSSVVPDSNFHIHKFSQDYIDCTPTFVSADMIGDLVQVDLDKPEELGADRLVNAVAVVKHYQTPAIVIDFGTATTFDVITEGGIYSGGLIAPGINLSVEALSAAAAKLPRVAIHTPKSVIGKNTVDAIQSGIYHGYLGLIEGIVERVTAEMKAKPFVLATGGLAQLFAPSTNAIDTIDQNLTLKGLYELAKRLEL
jgi:type III pantothenate kinase